MSLTQDDVQLLLVALKPTFDGIHRQFEQIDQRFEQMQKHYVQIDRRFELIEKHFVQIDMRLQKHDEHFQRIDIHLEHIDEQFKLIDTRFYELRQYMDTRFDEINDRIDILIKNIITDIFPEFISKKEYQQLEVRVSKIENKIDHIHIGQRH
ncbi:hypothetical protein KAZ66_00810 [Candidatus Woesebacteria bacterium]|nr:hypothetical protein [Candidatus Woesebacteria bacterium]